MITKITLQNIASYGKNPAILQTDKKINLIYGLNGTGKTTLSNYLQSKDSTIYSSCSIEGLRHEKVLVYNQKFIGANFYQDSQKGIFSLKSENKDAKDKIDQALLEIAKIENQISNNESRSGFQFDLDNIEQNIVNLRNEIEDKTWEIKTKYSGGERILDFCLEGKKGSKKELFDYLSTFEKKTNRPEKSIDELRKEAKAIHGEDARIYDENLIKKVSYNFYHIERHEIFKEIIVGNENTQIAGLIKKFNNSDWVKKGREFINEPQEENGICPFCQESTITKSLFNEIQNYFNETYQQKINELETLNQEYIEKYQSVINLKSELLQIDYIKNNEKEFQLLFKNFIDKLKNNLSKINDKTKSPNSVIELESSILEQNELNEFLDKIINEIKLQNDKVNNKKKTKNQIKIEFWEIMRWEYTQTIEYYNTQKGKLEGEKSNQVEKISKLRRSIDEQRTIVKEAQKEMVNIQDAIDAINRELKFFGLDGFFIVPDGEKTYKLQRPNEDIAKFTTLSEGEKTVISFLYFLELCKGKENNDEVVTEKIIVIDDPISSLSHMYVFNVSQLIRKNFFNDNYQQVFILTHNLYFFHELLHKQKDNNYKLFRLSRSEFSFLCEMNKKEIQNEYQSYWQILKDYAEGKATEVVVANAMRNILERFFGFIDKYDFNQLTVELEKDEKNKFFLRFINKESHSDPINISDSKEIDIQIFQNAFKQIFEDWGYIEHYNKMIKTD